MIRGAPSSASAVLHGTSEQTMRVGAFSVTLTRLEAGLRLPRHAHEEATLNIVLDGHYGETIGHGRLQSHGPATLIAKPAGAVHANIVESSAVECLVVNLGTQDLGDVTIRRTADVARIGGKLRVEMTCRARDGNLDAEELISALLDVSAGDDGTLPKQREPWLELVRELLHDGPALQSLDELGARVGRHPVYVARAFRGRYGKSVGEYARCIRLERARRLLHEGRITLSDVAARAGYSDQSHMTRDFQREFRVSPALYRRSISQVR
jgi:AraC family transcriptional regulator